MQKKAVGDATPTYGDSGVVESADGARFRRSGLHPRRRVGLFPNAFYKLGPRAEIHRRLRGRPRQHRVGGDVLGHCGRVDLVQGVVFGVVVVEVVAAVLLQVDRGQAVARHGAEIRTSPGLAAAGHGDALRFEFGVDGFDDRPGRVGDARRDLVDGLTRPSTGCQNLRFAPVLSAVMAALRAT